MISLQWLFAGVIVGLIVVSVFEPPKRQIASVPLPNDNSIYKTKSGCVTIKASEVACSLDAVSLNVIAGK